MSEKISSALTNALLGIGSNLTDTDYEPQEENQFQTPHIERVTITEKELLELVVKAILDDGQISDAEQKTIRDFWEKHGQANTRAARTYDFFVRAGVLGDPETGPSLTEAIAKALELDKPGVRQPVKNPPAWQAAADPVTGEGDPPPTVIVTVEELATMVAAALREGEAGKRVISDAEQKQIAEALKGKGIPEGASYQVWDPTLGALDDLAKVHVWPSAGQSATTVSNAPGIYDPDEVAVYESDYEKKLAVHQALFGSPEKLPIDAYLDARRLLYQDSDSPGSIAPEEQTMLVEPSDADGWNLGTRMYEYESAWLAATRATALSLEASQNGEGGETVTHAELVGILAAANSDGNLTRNRAPYIVSWLKANLHKLDSGAHLLYQQMTQMALLSGARNKNQGPWADDDVQTVIRDVTGNDATVDLDDLMEIVKKVGGPSGSHFGDSAYVTLRMLTRGANPSVTFTKEAEALHLALATIGIVHDRFETMPLLARTQSITAATAPGVAAVADASIETDASNKADASIETDASIKADASLETGVAPGASATGTITRDGLVQILIDSALLEGFAAEGRVSPYLQARIQSWIEANQGRLDPGARRLIRQLTRMGLLSDWGRRTSGETIESVIFKVTDSNTETPVVELDDLIAIVANATADGTFDPYDAASYVTLRQLTRHPDSPIAFSEEAEKLHMELVTLGIVCDGFETLPFVVTPKSAKG